MLCGWCGCELPYGGRMTLGFVRPCDRQECLGETGALYDEVYNAKWQGVSGVLMVSDEQRRTRLAWGSAIKRLRDEEGDDAVWLVWS